jgi:hypothetical protein
MTRTSTPSAAPGPTFADCQRHCGRPEPGEFERELRQQRIPSRGAHFADHPRILRGVVSREHNEPECEQYSRRAVMAIQIADDRLDSQHRRGMPLSGDGSPALQLPAQ